MAPSEKEKLRAIRRQLKRGPKLTRKARAAYTLAVAEMNEYGLPLEFEKPARRNIRAEVLAQIKTEVVRIGGNGTRQGFKFAQKMLERYPELRGA